MQNSKLVKSAFAITGVTLALSLAACSGGTPAAPSSSSSSMSPMASSSSPMAMPSTSASTADAKLEPLPAPMSTGDPYADAMTAAEHMPMVGKTLADGIAKGNKIAGDPDSPAAGLRSDLNTNLQEHVYLAGMAVATAYTKGADSAEFKLATAAVDKNAVAFSKMVGSIDPAMEAPVLKVWRDHIGYFVEYAVAAKKGDKAGMAKAQKELDGYTKTAGEAIAKLSKDNLKASWVTEGLAHHVMSLSAAIDDLAAGKTDAYGALHEAASHGGDFVSKMAVGLAKGAGLSGDAMDAASTLRTTLATTLQEHVYLASIAVWVAYTDKDGLDGAQFKAAAGALDHNSVALSEAIGSLAGKEKEASFLALWREHIGFFVDYAKADATKDTAAAKKALDGLDGYRLKSGEFFAEISNGELNANAIGNGLGMHISGLAGAIDSLAKALVK